MRYWSLWNGHALVSKCEAETREEAAEILRCNPHELDENSRGAYQGFRCEPKIKERRMNLYVVYMQDDKRTLLFVEGRDETEVRRIMRDRTSTNYDIRGILATARDPGIFEPDAKRLEELAEYLVA